MFTTFIINMPKSNERRIRCTKSCREAGIEPEIFPAVDGKLLKLGTDYSSESEVTINLGMGRKAIMSDALSPSEAGCALSHLSIYREILKRNLDMALILEDDVLLMPDFLTAAREILLKNNIWDIALVRHSSGLRRFYPEKNISLVRIHDENVFLKKEGMGILDPIFNRRRMVFIASCYFINRKACQRLLDIGFPVRFPADYLLGYPAYHKLRIFTCHPQNILARSAEDTSVISSRPKHKLL